MKHKNDIMRILNEDGTVMLQERNKEILIDRLFIQEAINSLVKQKAQGSKAWQMLCDWSRELRQRSFTQGKTKKLFMQSCPPEQWMRA